MRDPAAECPPSQTAIVRHDDKSIGSGIGRYSIIGGLLPENGSHLDCVKSNVPKEERDATGDVVIDEPTHAP
jgi:hypothetical protein